MRREAASADMVIPTPNGIAEHASWASSEDSGAQRAQAPYVAMKPVRSLIRLLDEIRHRSQGLSFFVAASGVAIQVLLALIVSRHPETAQSDFTTEIRVLAVGGAIVSLAALIAPNRRAFWAVMAIRLLVLGALLGAVRDGEVILHLLVFTPLLMELMTYERLPLATGCAVAATAGYVVFLALFSAQPLVFVVVGGAGGAFVAALCGFVKFYRESLVDYNRRVTSLEGAFQQLTDSNLGLQVYATNAESESATKERTRITRELHDSVGYALTNIAMMMKAARVLMNKDHDELQNMLVQAQDLANEAVGEARGILHRLRNVDDQSYQGLWAISRLVKAYRLATSVDVEVHYGNVEWSLGHTIDAAVYRLVQEGLTNAYRHGGATRVRITMWMDDRETIVQIWDNGRGAPVVHEGIGLAGMRERFAEHGGSVEAGNTVDGFEVTGRVPWKAEGGLIDPNSHRR